MDHRRARDARGFTLIELLVVVAVIALLISILMPVLGNSKAAARTVVCGSNLRQLMIGWRTVMNEQDGRIPYTLSPVATSETWHGLLQQAIESARHDPNAQQRLNYSCPEVDFRYPGVAYSSASFGYSVNTRWKFGDDLWPTGTGNEGKQWDHILTPSEYPWLADPWVRSTNLAVSYVGAADDAGDDEWGVGFYHPSDRAMAAFADGRASLVEREAVSQIEATEPVWFINR